MADIAINQGLLGFLQASPTPFHAVRQMRAELDEAGFQSLSEQENWGTLAPGGYYVTRNDSSIIAFRVGRQPVQETGWRMIGAHTDSPCLQVKPNPDMRKHGFYQLGVQVYGGALLNPWFDRDLSLAGRVTYKSSQGDIRSALVDFARPVAVVPSLAIHLDKGVNDNRKVNPQTQMPLVLGLAGNSDDGSDKDFSTQLAQQLAEQGVGDVEQVLAFEISCYDCQPPATVGLAGDFIASARLDNLLSCYVGMQALLAADGEVSSLLVCNDHEEVGSNSAAGAAGPFLQSVLQRIGADSQQIIARSMMISADNAHGIHPNYADKHDECHGPLLNAGPVIKVNANQRYATNSETSAVFRDICSQQAVPVQTFVVRSDMGCGSTIGPITATELGVPTLDIGVPTFAMHSIRELAGSQDIAYLHQALQAFCDVDQLPWG